MTAIFLCYPALPPIEGEARVDHYSDGVSLPTESDTATGEPIQIGGAGATPNDKGQHHRQSYVFGLNTDLPMSYFLLQKRTNILHIRSTRLFYPIYRRFVKKCRNRYCS